MNPEYTEPQRTFFKGLLERRMKLSKETLDEAYNFFQKRYDSESIKKKIKIIYNELKSESL